MVPKSIVLFGDSLLARIGTTTSKKIEQALPGVVVYNCATGGWNTEDGVRHAHFIAKLKADYVVLSFGANDGAPWKEKIVPEKEFKKNLSEIVDAFSGSRVVLFTCPPAYDSKDLKGTRRFNDSLNRYNKIVKSVAKSHKLKLIDSEKEYTPLLKHKENYHEEDGLHLNDIGYDVFARALTRLYAE